MYEDAKVKEALARIVRHVCPDPALHEDLLQEGIIHLWRQLSHHPDQTQSWYLHSCKFHLQHCLNQGRSVDALKRRREWYVVVDSEPGDEGENFHNDRLDTSFIARVSAREIYQLVSKELPARGRAVLARLAECKSAREIGRELNISHSAVIKYRRRIAALLLKLGIAPPAKCNGRNREAITNVCSDGINGSRAVVSLSD